MSTRVKASFYSHTLRTNPSQSNGIIVEAMQHSNEAKFHISQDIFQYECLLHYTQEIH